MRVLVQVMRRVTHARGQAVLLLNDGRTQLG
jgi:hypothetical protein